MKVSLKILESNKQISLMIGKALQNQVDKFMSNSLKIIEKGLPDILTRAIETSPEYYAILSGDLKYELGIPNSASVLQGLINTWTRGVVTSYSPVVILSSGQIKTSFSVSMVRADFSDVLSTSYAFVYDYKRGYALPWLKWLLLDGTMPIVNGYEVEFGPNPRSRTGMAIMVETTGKAWNVPANYAGNANDNWITRAIRSSERDIEKFIQKVLQK